MKRPLLFLLSAFYFLLSVSVPAQTRTLMVSTNGTLLAPTNFFTVNAALLPASGAPTNAIQSWIAASNAPLASTGFVASADTVVSNGVVALIPGTNGFITAAQGTNLVQYQLTNGAATFTGDGSGLTGVQSAYGLTDPTVSGSVTFMPEIQKWQGNYSGTFAGTFTGTLTGNATGLEDLTHTSSVQFDSGAQKWAGNYSGSFTGNGGGLTNLNLNGAVVVNGGLEFGVGMTNSSNYTLDFFHTEDGPGKPIATINASGFLGTFTGNGSGLTNRPLESALAFGAVGNGVADDTAAIQAALDRGGLVFLPRGSYKTTATLRVPVGGGLIGAGRNASLVMAEIGTDNTPSVTGTNMLLRDFSVSSSYTSATNSDAYGSHARAVRLGSGCVVVGVGVTNAATGFEMSAGGVCNVTLENVTGGNLRNSLGYGEFIHGDGVSNVVIRGFACSGSDRGIEFENGSKRITVKDGELVDCYPTGYAGQPWGYYTNYSFVLDTHTHDGLGTCEDITFRDIRLINAAAPINAGGASWNDAIRNVLYDNISISNVVKLTTAQAMVAGQYCENVTVSRLRTAPQVTAFDYVFYPLESRNFVLRDSLFEAAAVKFAFLTSSSTGTRILGNEFAAALVGTLSVTRTSNVATVTTDRPHGLVVGQTFDIQGIAASGYNGTAQTVVSVTSATNFTWSNSGSDAASAEILGTISMGSGSSISDAGIATEISGNTFRNPKNGGVAIVRQEAGAVGSRYTGNRFLLNPTFTTATRSRSGNVATITTALAHGFASNDLVTVTGLGGTGYNAAGVRVTSVPSSTSFTYANTGSAEGSTGDTAGTAYKVLGYSNSGSPSYALRITGAKAIVTDNYLWSGHPSTSPRLYYVDSVVAGGCLATISHNAGTWANGSATVVQSTAGSSNFVSVGNVTTAGTWTQASPSYTSIGDMNGTAQVPGFVGAITSSSTVTARRFVATTNDWQDGQTTIFWGTGSAIGNAVTNSVNIVEVGDGTLAMTMAATNGSERLGFITEAPHGVASTNNGLTLASLYCEPHLHVRSLTNATAAGGTNATFQIIYRACAAVDGSTYGPITNVIPVGLGTTSKDVLVEASHLGFTNFHPSVAANFPGTWTRIVSPSNNYSGSVVVKLPNVHFPVQTLGSSTDNNP